MAVAIAGNGGNAPELSKPVLGSGSIAGGNGGAGGQAYAACQSLVFPVVPQGCRAVSIGGQGGHGASGQNQLAPGGAAGNGGNGGGAQAWSCCGCSVFQGSTIRGDAVAVAGSAGNGANGGNSGLAGGGAAGNGGNSGFAAASTLLGDATISPGCPLSVARAVGGSSGNGGNGGSGTAGGSAGTTGVVFPAFAQSFCYTDPKATETVSGPGGVAGVKGNP